MFDIEWSPATPDLLGHGSIRGRRDFGRPAFALPADIGCGHVDENRVVAGLGKFQDAPDAEGIKLQGGVNLFVERDRRSTGHHNLHLTHEPFI